MREMKYTFKLSIAYIIFFVGIVFFLSACGYKPIGVVAKTVFDEAIYVEVKVDSVEPENAPLIRDEINRVVYTRFQKRVSSKEEATNSLIVSYQGSTFTPIGYENGYIVRYLANVRVRFEMKSKTGKQIRTITAVHEGDIEATTLNSASLRTQAISQGVRKALDQFVAFVCAKGSLIQPDAK